MNKNGVTLIEVLVIIAIIGILTAITKVSLERESNPPIKKIDGCEYVVFGWGSTQSVTHKGNCPNPIHYKLPVVE